MKVSYTSANCRLTFEFESDNDKTLVTNLAHIQEVFEEQTCGCCKSERIRFDVREFDGNHYYKLFCDECHATLDFGQHKTGNTLFTKRFEKDTRDPLPNRGWYQYKKADEPLPPTKPASAPPKATAAPSTNHSTKPPTNGQAPTIEQKHAGVLRGYRNATCEADVQTVAAWANKHDFAPHHHEEQADAYNAALDRLGIGIDAIHGNIPF